MNLKLASSAGVVALLGVVLQLRPGADVPKAKAAAAPASAKSSTPKGGDTKRAHEGPWIATCRHEGIPTERKIDPNDTPDAARFCMVPGDQIKYAVATIPDPARTRLSHLTDRALESILRAAQETGWDSDSQWLPWVYKSGEGESKWRASDEEISEPGLMLFRERATKDGFPARLLLIFIVGETPTGGIDLEAISRAEAYGDLLAPKQDDYFVIGPTFTGSLPSMARNAATTARQYFILSGTITDRRYKDAFKAAAPNAVFRSSAVETAETLGQVYAVAEKLNINRCQVAVLAEDNTAFGRSYQDLQLHAGERDCAEPTMIHFPRDVSSLRNSYQGAAGSAGPEGKGGKAGETQSNWLRDEGGDDTVPVFDKTHTPQTQYAVVNGIVKTIRENSRLVEIAGTNVLDTLFLAKAIAAGAPNVRIVVAESDALFIHAALEDHLSGTLAITPYPPPLWKVPRAPNIQFPDSYAQEEYQATARLLNFAYFQPAQTQRWQVPHGLWVTQATPVGYWPMIAPTGGLPPKLPPAPSLFRFFDAGTCVIVIGLIVWVVRALAYSKRAAELFTTAWTSRFLGVCVGIAIAINMPLVLVNGPLDSEVRLGAWRALQLNSGVSTLVPLLCLWTVIALGCFAQMWRASLAEYRNPGLPMPHGNADAKAAMATYRQRALDAIGYCTPHAGVAIGALLTALLMFAKPWQHLQTLDPAGYPMIFLASGLVAMWFVLASAVGLFRIWSALRGVLAELNRMPLDGAFRRIPRGFSAAIWLEIPNRRMYGGLFRSRDCLEEWGSPVVGGLDFLLGSLRRKEASGEPDHIEYGLATSACHGVANAIIASYLEPRWTLGQRDPDLGEKTVDAAEHLPAGYRCASDFVALRYAAWIRYVVAHMRNLLWHVSIGFALMVVALNTLHFQSPQILRYFLTATFGLAAVPMLLLFAQVERNPVLSRMAETKSGELGLDFYLKFASFGLLPMISVLSTVFPDLAQFLTSWLQPTLESLK